MAERGAASLAVEEQVLPDNRSFLDIVNGVPAPSASAPALAFPLPWLVTVCAALVALCAAVYGTIGYVQDKPVAGAERQMPEHAAGLPQRAGLPQSQDRAREELPVAAAGPDTASNIVPAAPSGADLDPAEPRLADPQAINAAALLRGNVTGQSGGSFAQLWTRIGARDAEEKLDRLSAEYAELAEERDQLRERVKQLEQGLALLPAPSGPLQPARAPANNPSGASSAMPGAAVIAFPGAAASGPAAEQSRQAYRNFTPPGSAPNYFSDESGAILGTHNSATRR
jgi:hypothetical protein